MTAESADPFGLDPVAARMTVEIDEVESDRIGVEFEGDDDVRIEIRVDDGVVRVRVR